MDILKRIESLLNDGNEASKKELAEAIEATRVELNSLRSRRDMLKSELAAMLTGDGDPDITPKTNALAETRLALEQLTAAQAKVEKKLARVRERESAAERYEAETEYFHGGLEKEPETLGR